MGELGLAVGVGEISGVEVAMGVVDGGEAEADGLVGPCGVGVSDGGTDEGAGADAEGETRGPPKQAATTTTTTNGIRGTAALPARPRISV
jgi:hypothetical protein